VVCCHFANAATQGRWAVLNATENSAAITVMTGMTAKAAASREVETEQALKRYQDALRLQQSPDGIREARQIYKELLAHPVLAVSAGDNVAAARRNAGTALQASPVATLRYVVHLNYALVLLEDRGEPGVEKEALEHLTFVRYRIDCVFIARRCASMRPIQVCGIALARSRCVLGD
jgi:hypothetical protein